MQTKLKENSIKIKEIKSLGIEIRTSPIVGIKSRGTIVDNKALVFVIWASETETNSPKRIYRPQFSTNQGIVDVFTGYFHYLWGV